MKCISSFLILSLLYYCLGCYNTKIIKQDTENNNSLKETITENSDQEMYIVTQDWVKYYFPPNMYEIKNDTLQGTGQKFYHGQRQVGEYVIKIDLGNIKQIKFEELSISRTVILVISSVLIITIVYVGISVGSSMDEMPLINLN